MKQEHGIGRHRIGAWDFNPASGELRRHSDVRRLEPRAAKVLALLCDAQGNVVTHETLNSAVWGGRTLSDNSLAVVIGQLRRALDDDAREPRIIETIPKRGYRLAEAHRAGDALPRPKSRLLVGVVALIVAIIAGFGLIGTPRHAAIVGVTDVRNETGDARYAALAQATSELIVNELDKRGFDVRRSSTADLSLASKLVMWDGAPYLGMTLTDRSRTVRWSAMIRATPGQVPQGVQSELDSLKARVAEPDQRR